MASSSHVAWSCAQLGDAIAAVEARADAVLASNYGGRQLDGAPAANEFSRGTFDRRRRVQVAFDSGI
ncbi:alpha-hydroxy-acid oxidizing protein [Pseudonocardia xinjiangensis]|uniref:alpha-hydroxy-acid oxidizing protein n=1 Tax=Pseudonocardia xinjiangensis TaxID=75289 RepID=UPI003D932825